MPAHMTKSPGVDLSVPRRRFLLVVLAVVACAIASNLYIRSVGHTYVYRLDEYAGQEVLPDGVQVDPPGMVDYEVGYDGDVPVITFHALQEGFGMATVSSDGGGGMFAVEVRPGNVVVADEANFTGWEVVGWSIVACFGVATAVSAWNFAWLWRRSWYGYEMAGNAGFALFCFSQTMNFLYAMLSGRAHDFIDLAELVVFLSDRFVWLMLPVMAIAGVFVSLSNVALVRREGRGLVNLLGVLASLAWATACVAWRFVSGLDFVSYEVYVASFGLKSLVATGLAFAAALLVGTSLCAWLAARHVPSMPRDYLVILGCGLRHDGSPTPLLAGRVDAARAFAQRQVEAGMPQPTFVPSGGKGDDERWAEAESMRRYLVERGVSEEHIIPEDQSTSTRENFRFSAEKIAEAHAGASAPARVAFSTTNYHVFRSYVFAHEVGLDAEGIAAPTKLYFWPNAFLREFVGLLAARPVPIVLAFLLFSALYVAAEYVMLLG